MSTKEVKEELAKLYVSSGQQERDKKIMTASRNLLLEDMINQDELWDRYVEHVDLMQDSLEHKIYLLSNEKCFLEWCEEMAQDEI